MTDDLVERIARAMYRLITEPGLHPEKHMTTYRVLARAALEAITATGYVVVPREATYEMAKAACEVVELLPFEEVWRAMIDAAESEKAAATP